jgi:hypothetical protein
MPGSKLIGNCIDCQKPVPGFRWRCRNCYTRKRICPDCGWSYAGQHDPCSRCWKPRPCPKCDQEQIMMCSRYCDSCSWPLRICEACGTRKPSHYAYLCTVCVRKLIEAEHGAIGRTTERQRRAIWHGKKCVYCGYPAESADHVRPIQRGGKDEISNMVPACKLCNNSKSNRLLNEWQYRRARRRSKHGDWQFIPVSLSRARRISPIVVAEIARLASLPNSVSGAL